MFPYLLSMDSEVRQENGHDKNAEEVVKKTWLWKILNLKNLNLGYYVGNGIIKPDVVWMKLLKMQPREDMEMLNKVKGNVCVQHKMDTWVFR